MKSKVSGANCGLFTVLALGAAIGLGCSDSGPEQVACGEVDQPCCNGSCNQGFSCQSDLCTAMTSACGASGQDCCTTGDACQSGLTCKSGECAPSDDLLPLNGTAAGIAFSAKDGIAADVTAGSACSKYGLLITITNAAGSCARAGDVCQAKKNLLEVQLDLIRSSPIAAGRYNAVPAPQQEGQVPTDFMVTLAKTDASCVPADAASMPRLKQTGSVVTIDSVTAGVVNGSADLQFEDGGILKGTFSTTSCPALTPQNGLCAPPAAPPRCSGAPSCQ